MAAILETYPFNSGQPGVLYKEDLSNYVPISHLSFLSKLTEQVFKLDPLV